MSNNLYLLDTHCLIWFQESNPLIPQKILNIIQNPENVIFFSQISLFEITIKQKIQKLPDFIASVEEVHNQAISDGFVFLNIENSHIYQYSNVPFVEHHRDPFDRLLLATAFVEHATILSNDRNFKLYNALVESLW